MSRLVLLLLLLLVVVVMMMIMYGSDWNLQEWKMTVHQKTGGGFAGLEHDGLENDGVEQEQTYNTAHDEKL